MGKDGVYMENSNRKKGCFIARQRRRKRATCSSKFLVDCTSPNQPKLPANLNMKFGILTEIAEINHSGIWINHCM